MSYVIFFNKSTSIIYFLRNDYFFKKRIEL